MPYCPDYVRESPCANCECEPAEPEGLFCCPECKAEFEGEEPPVPFPRSVAMGHGPHDLAENHDEYLEGFGE